MLNKCEIRQKNGEGNYGLPAQHKYLPRVTSIRNSELICALVQLNCSFSIWTCTS